MALPDDLRFLRQSVERKIDRARQHLRDVTSRVGALSKRGEAYDVSREVQPDGIHESFHFHILQAIPEDLPVILGEFLHDCRSALDNMVYALWTKHRGKPPKSSERIGVGFPIAKTIGHFKPADQIAGIPPESLAVIERMQPYHRGDTAKWHPLMQLSTLNNIDKHRHIHVGFWQFASLGWFGNAEGQWVRGNTGRLIDGAEIARFKWKTKPDPNVEFDFHCKVVLSEEPQPLNSVDAVILGIFREVIRARDELIVPQFGS